MESLDILLGEHGARYTPEEKTTFAERKNEYYKTFLRQMSPSDLADEVRSTLMELHKLNIRMAIGSSSKNTPFILERIGLSDFFDAISDGNNISQPKPDPEVFLKAAKMLALSPHNCLVVEDATAGIQAALNGKFDCAAIGNAYHDVNPTYRLQRFSDLVCRCCWIQGTGVALIFVDDKCCNGCSNDPLGNCCCSETGKNEKRRICDQQERVKEQFLGK